ncbi:hypothetical protein OEZ85_011075 [Tetradesmus obliquus]|uniref:Uncharacterized protein n=1 Tax=Tetradesmus obliquus TaxID=3088 RepID=A0ABY8TPL4_TETOB|nr:hypothetical protein OEZ85_011075 [Tetradesmus obliquus]
MEVLSVGCLDYDYRTHELSEQSTAYFEPDGSVYVIPYTGHQEDSNTYILHSRDAKQLTFGPRHRELQRHMYIKAIHATSLNHFPASLLVGDFLSTPGIQEGALFQLAEDAPETAPVFTLLADKIDFLYRDQHAYVPIPIMAPGPDQIGVCVSAGKKGLRSMARQLIIFRC